MNAAYSLLFSGHIQNQAVMPIDAEQQKKPALNVTFLSTSLVQDHFPDHYVEEILSHISQQWVETKIL